MIILYDTPPAIFSNLKFTCYLRLSCVLIIHTHTHTLQARILCKYNDQTNVYLFWHGKYFLVFFLLFQHISDFSSEAQYIFAMEKYYVDDVIFSVRFIINSTFNFIAKHNITRLSVYGIRTSFFREMKNVVNGNAYVGFF